MNNADLIKQALGSLYVPSIVYTSPLPLTLRQWYAYTKDGGHSIICVIKSDYKEARNNNDFLIPVPVKTVLRGYEYRHPYIIVALKYTMKMGLECPVEDEEF